MNQLWIYQLLDIMVTITEALTFSVFTISFLKRPRFQKSVCLLVPGLVVFLCAVIMTWFTPLGGLKVFPIAAAALLCNKCLYKDSMLSIITTYEIWFVFAEILPETIAFSAMYWFWDGNFTTVVGGTEMIRWQVYLPTILVRLLLMIILYMFLRNYRYQLQLSDFIVLTVDFLVVFTMYFIPLYGFLNLEMAEWYGIYGVVAIIGFVFMIHFLYLKNTMYLRELKKEDELKIETMNRQFAYYQDKQKDEERIRAIYHDMKNHLLVLEGSQGTEATRQMAQELRAQIADYENYVHTGNAFLDIIIKDKAEKARRKHIDLSAAIDFSGIDFIAPLDISTLFGNGIDNAIEASEKLPEEQRVILIKAGKVQDFVFILMENNCLEEALPAGRHTTKPDRLLHGFGIANMQRAAEKYNGTCTTSRVEGKFTLKILLPSP